MATSNHAFRNPAARLLSLAAFALLSSQASAAWIDEFFAGYGPFGTRATAETSDLHYPDDFSYPVLKNASEGDRLSTRAEAAVIGPNTQGSSYAELSTGKMGFLAARSGGDSANYHASAGSTFWETLSFSNNAGIGLLEPMELKIDGLKLGGPSAIAAYAIYANDISYSGWLTGDTSVWIDFVLPTGKTEHKFYASIWGRAYDTGDLIDYSHTLTVNYKPTAGVTMSSASGEFLTAQAVPEPATFAVLGLGAVALIRRRRRGQA